LAFHSGREADHSPPSSSEAKEWVELYLHSPNTPSWRGAQLHGTQGQLFKHSSVKTAKPDTFRNKLGTGTRVYSCNL
jgi:hypothetical protein